jgi:hypothetical protein
MKISGEGGIRTLDTLLAYTHFPGVLFRPLRHLSVILFFVPSGLFKHLSGKISDGKCNKKTAPKFGAVKLNYNLKTILTYHHHGNCGVIIIERFNLKWFNADELFLQKACAYLRID